MDAAQQSVPAAAAAAASDPAANPSALIDPSTAAAGGLSAYFRVMRLGDDDSSPREQQPRPQVPVPAEALMQQLQAAARQDFPYPRSYCAGESSSTGAGYVPPYSSLSAGGFYASHFGAHSPRLNAAPVSPPEELDAGAGHSSVPAASSHPSESYSSSTPSPSASPYPYQQLMPSAPPLGAAGAAYQWGNGSNSSSLNPYASAFQGTLGANPAGMDYYRSWIPTPARCYPTLEHVRSRLLRRPMELDLLMIPQAAAHVARLLEEGDEKVRRSVLAKVRGDVCGVAASIEGQAVLLALVRACAGRPDELRDIVHAMYKSNGFSMGLAKHYHGMGTLLKELARNLAPYPQMLVQFVCWLLRERLMEQYQGAELLQYCFTTMFYEDSKVIIQFATAIINELLFSSFGSRCLAECLVYARDGELRALEKVILGRTIEIAMGQYSNYFLQRAIELGSKLLQAAIAERVAADVVNLSVDRFGSYVVEACFLLARTPAPLQRLLAAFQGLRDDALAELVRGNYSNYVVSKLLDAGRQHFPQEARALARRIEMLPAPVQREMHARRVMMVVNKLTNKHLRSQPTLY
ncbi:unnamed protein product [Urochloa decumbens]|uniref:PUM-HD domain-containing protein n=1 Tax=Urochloa decumbens TaxID=240449 RepID=A0ABC8XAC1_9POAL